MMSDLPSDGFLGAVAEQPFCPFIPACDHAVESLADNGVIAGIHNRSKQTNCFIRFQPQQR